MTDNSPNNRYAFAMSTLDRSANLSRSEHASAEVSVVFDCQSAASHGIGAGVAVVLKRSITHHLIYMVGLAVGKET